MPHFSLESISSSHLFQALFANTLQSVALIGKDMKILAFNEVFKNQVLSMRGKNLEVGESFFQLTEKETHGQVEKDFKQAFEGHEVEGIRQLHNADGREFVTRYNYNPIRNERGEVFAVAAFYQNITAEAEAQRLARESGRLLDLLFEQAHDGVFIYNTREMEIKANPEFLRIFELDGESLKKTIFQSRTKGSWVESKPFSLSHLGDLPLKKEVDAQIQTPSGQSLFVRLFKNEISGPFGAKIIVLTVSDKTATLLAQKKQAEGEEKFEAIARHFPNGNVTLINQNMEVVFSDGIEFETDLGEFKPEIGKPVLENYGPPFRETLKLALENAFKGKTSQLELKTGKKTYSLQINPLAQNVGKIDLVMKMAQNVSAQENARVEARMQKEYLRQIIDVDPNFIYVKNRERNVLIANKSIAGFFGCTEAEFLEKSQELLKTYRWKHEEVEQLEGQVFSLQKTIISEEAIFHKETKRMHLFQVTRTPFFIEAQEECILFVGVDVTDRVNAENELITQREYLRHILDTDPSLIFVKDQAGKYKLVNKAFADFYQTSVEEILGKTDQSLKWSDVDRKQFELTDKQVLETNESITVQETTINPTTGRKAHFISTKRPLLDAEGNVNILGVVTDITEQVLHEEKLQKSEEMLQEIFNRVADALFILDGESLVVIDCNNQAVVMLEGKDKNDCLAHSIEKVARLKEPAPEFWTNFFYQLKYVNPSEEAELLTLEGKTFWGGLAATQFQKDGKSLLLLRISDITVQKESEEQIIQALHEKEILIQEIHHRVKNNMAVISSLLQLQTGYIKDPGLIDVFKDSQSRIKSMALIHEKLYQSKTLAKVEMDSYIKDLSRTLLSTYNSRRANIRINTQVDNVFLDINSAVPCGLIINEIVSNACKHAFKDRNEGNIDIVFSKEGDLFKLELKDDGIGMPAGTDFSNFQSLGMNLVHALASQLGAQLEIQPQGGIRFTLTFTEKIKPVRDQVRPGKSN